MQNKQTSQRKTRSQSTESGRWLSTVGCRKLSRPPGVPPGGKDLPFTNAGLVGSGQPRWLLLILPWSSFLPPLSSYFTSCCFSEWFDWWIIQQSNCKLLYLTNFATAEETVQNISRGSCLLCTCSPRPQSATYMQEGTQICSASPKYPCDMNIYQKGRICCVCLGW